MSNPKSPFLYESHLTADGSPTLSLDGGEKMHSMEGALAESLYIYRPCIEQALAASRPHILSMGLGLAYNEMITGAVLLTNNISQFKLASFETVDPLKKHCMAWVNDETCELAPLYNTILEKVAAQFDLSSDLLKSFLYKALKDQHWTIFDRLPENNPWPWKFHGILYDAFSSETDKDLWTEHHLRHFLKAYGAPDLCYFSTYAATGNLKRSLLQEGFSLEKRKGFGKKRESTHAKRD